MLGLSSFGRRIEYSPTLDAAFFFPCRLPGETGNCDAAFTSREFRNWKTATEDMKRHEQSISHQIAVPVWLQSSRLSEKDSSVAQLVSSGHQTKVQLNRRNVETIFQAVLFLGKQGLPFRGHSEKDVTSNRGNFLELLN